MVRMSAEKKRKKLWSKEHYLKFSIQVSSPMTNEMEESKGWVHAKLMVFWFIKMADHMPKVFTELKLWSFLVAIINDVRNIIRTAWKLKTEIRAWVNYIWCRSKKDFLGSKKTKRTQNNFYEIKRFEYLCGGYWNDLGMPIFKQFGNRRRSAEWRSKKHGNVEKKFFQLHTSQSHWRFFVGKNREFLFLLAKKQRRPSFSFYRRLFAVSVC